VEEGKYGFWGNEYIDIRKTPSAQASTVNAKLKAATGIPAQAIGGSTGAISLTAMHAIRGGPTTDPAHQ
jgi:hypothetical protein